ncbi:MAG: DNA mismatch repair endonuclease MutL, partial [Clostridia bacterium]|nr:DNA mismatch repair endonuclease MutL [Clostridia bacterium]
MGKINVLGFDIANLIAAGEVVDRPASVVKELCENALDAGATSVTVEIRHGGTSFIRVSDNGVGIDSEDMPLTVLRHATSKISTAEDLQSIGTLGFRGEALAAIAAVCKMKMLSKTADSHMGTSMTCEGGEIIDITEAGCAKGTTVVAAELFYNVPARRKFLKKDASECAAITAVMEKMALSAPGVAMKYIT